MEIEQKINIPQIGFGTFPQKEKLLESVPMAIKHGYRLIDTSDNYLNEEFVGKALGKIDSETLSKTTVISKFSQPLRTYELEKCFDESKAKLNNKLNIYLLHWPFPFLWKEEWKRMEELYLSGKCDAIGVCNFEEKHLRKLFKFCRIKPMFNQFECHPTFQQKSLVDFCRKNGITVIAYSPLARLDKKTFENETLNAIARKHNKTVGQIILRWHIEHGYRPIPSSSSENHIAENFDVFDFKLDKSDIERIDSLECGNRVRFNPNTRFTFRQKMRFLICRIKNFFKNLFYLFYWVN